MLKNLANAVLFQCGWFACVLGGDSLWLLVGWRRWSFTCCG